MCREQPLSRSRPVYISYPFGRQGAKQSHYLLCLHKDELWIAVHPETHLSEHEELEGETVWGGHELVSHEG